MGMGGYFGEVIERPDQAWVYCAGTNADWYPRLASFEITFLYIWMIGAAGGGGGGCGRATGTQGGGGGGGGGCTHLHFMYAGRMIPDRLNIIVGAGGVGGAGGSSGNGTAGTAGGATSVAYSDGETTGAIQTTTGGGGGGGGTSAAGGALGTLGSPGTATTGLRAMGAIVANTQNAAAATAGAATGIPNQVPLGTGTGSGGAGGAGMDTLNSQAGGNGVLSYFTPLMLDTLGGNPGDSPVLSLNGGDWPINYTNSSVQVFPYSLGGGGGGSVAAGTGGAGGNGGRGCGGGGGGAGTTTGGAGGKGGDGMVLIMAIR